MGRPTKRSRDTSLLRFDALGLYDAISSSGNTYTEVAYCFHSLQFEANRDIRDVQSFQERVDVQ